MNLEMELIGKRIKNRRKELKLTQNDIKSMTGISSGNMIDIENGKRLPAASTLLQLAEVLQCSIDWILTGKTPLPEKYNLSQIGEFEKELLDTFCKLEKDDQYEILEIAQMKLRKKMRGDAKSSSSDDPDFLKNVENGDIISA